MRRALATVVLLMTSYWSMGAFGAQAVGCDSNVSRIGFTDQIQGGQPFELWKCEDQWHLSNLANEQIYTKKEKDKDKTCIKNSTTGEEFCCPQVQKDATTKTQAPKDATMATSYSCGTGGSDNATATTEDKKILYVEPAPQNGNRSSMTYKIEGSESQDDSSGAGGNAKKKVLSISVLTPESPNKKEGTITVESNAGGPSISHAGKGGPKNSCNKDATSSGSFCQLPANIIGHNYKLTKETKGAVKDDPAGSAQGDQNVKSDGTGRTNYSEGGAAK